MGEGISWVGNEWMDQNTELREAIGRGDDRRTFSSFAGTRSLGLEA